MLLNSTQVVPRSQHEEESALLRCKIVELNWNTIRLIAEAEKLIQESKQLSASGKGLFGFVATSGRAGLCGSFFLSHLLPPHKRVDF